MDGSANSLKETKYMSFEIKKNELLVKYNEIWDKVSNIIGKIIRYQIGFFKKSIFKLNYFNGKNNTDSFNKKIPKEIVIVSA